MSAYQAGYTPPRDTLNTRLGTTVSESAFIIHTIPDFHPDAEIVGLCHVPLIDSHPERYGWMVSDFLAFKYLLHGVGLPGAQSWLSLIDIEQAIEEHSCTYKHTGKDVTAAKDTNIAVIPQTNQLIDRFIDQIRIRAVKARYYKTTLVILAFGPVTPEQDLCFGLEEDSFINTHQLRQAILAGEEFDIPVILLTPSVFTSGWAVNPVLCGSSHFAAKRNVKLISLSCGSVFAADLTHKFTERTTPLLKDSERAKIPYDDLMPIYPSNEQRQLRDTLHTSIHQTLIQRVPQLAPGHFFDFSAKHDAWEVYAPRRGRSLRFWRDKWGPSSIASPVPPAVASSLGSAFGGTVESQVFHVRFLARLEIHTSRKDRFNIKTQKTNQLLELSQHPYLGVQHVLKDVFEAIEFRAARISLVSLVAKYLDLPFPNGMKCRFWGEVMEDGPQRDAWVHLMGVFSPCALPPGINRTDHNDITYWKPVAWLAAAIGSKFKNNSRQDIEAFIAQQVRPAFNDVRSAQSAILLNHGEVRELGTRWLKSVGFAEDAITPASNAHLLRLIEKAMPPLLHRRSVRDPPKQ